MSKKRAARKRVPIHPGEHLADILSEAGLSANALALKIRVPANRITAIVSGRRGISADTALRLAKFFGTSIEFWMNLQSRYDVDMAMDASADQIDRDVIPMAHMSH